MVAVVTPVCSEVGLGCFRTFDNWRLVSFQPPQRFAAKRQEKVRNKVTHVNVNVSDRLVVRTALLALAETLLFAECVVVGLEPQIFELDYAEERTRVRARSKVMKIYVLECSFVFFLSNTTGVVLSSATQRRGKGLFMPQMFTGFSISFAIVSSPSLYRFFSLGPLNPPPTTELGPRFCNNADGDTACGIRNSTLSLPMMFGLGHPFSIHRYSWASETYFVNATRSEFWACWPHVRPWQAMSGPAAMVTGHRI